jgi:hypothetical protein
VKAWITCRHLEHQGMFVDYALTEDDVNMEKVRICTTYSFFYNKNPEKFL